LYSIEIPIYKCYHLQLGASLSAALGLLPPYYNNSSTSDHSS